MADRQEYVINIQQAKQIATIKWLLYKAYNNNIPEELKEPFYYDRRQPLAPGKTGILHLKPAIVYLLAKAELYCLALANIYLDPNYHNLNHCGVIQALARKGIVLSDPQLTETVLLQTSPLKLTAHLCVIEAIMMLYAKEIVTSDRVFAAIKKFSSSQQRFNDSNSNTVIPQWSPNDYDQLLLLWISETVSALNGRIKRQILETQEKDSNEKTKDHFKIPIKELTELCDGVALCALVSYYCPQTLQWQKILVNKPATNADYNHNLNLFYNFCQCSLPHSIFHMSPQDMFPQSINYMRINLIALLVDLFNVLEIHPANCVVSENQNGITMLNSESNFASAQFEPAYTRRNGYNNIQKCPLTTQQMSVIPNLRNYSNTQNSSSTESRTTNSSPRVDRKSRNNSVSESQNEQFVVHKSRNIPTLGSINSDSCHKEKIEPIAAGKPTNWNESRKSQITGSGRRSRRNSFSDESQLTIENFGGSHENLSVLGRNPDKEPAVHVVKTTVDETGDNDAGVRQLRSQENWSSAAISSLLRENNDSPQRPNSNASAASSATSGSSASEKLNGMRNFSAPPTTNVVPSAETAEMLESCKVSSQMLNIRLKLEEKRRQIELDKRRMELNLKKQRQKLNKAAFLQAVSKIENDNVTSNKEFDVDGGGNDNGGGSNDIICDDIDNDSIVAYDEIDKSEVVFSKPNITSFAPSSGSNQVEQKWLKNSDIDVNGEISPKSDRQTPDSDNLDIEKCQKSISEMDSSLHAIQTDLQWLAVKENEMLQGPENVTHPDLPKSYPVSFMLNQDVQQPSQNHPIQKILVNSHQNQNGFFTSPVDYGSPDSRANYNTLPNKNFTDYNFADGCSTCTQHTQHHHLSLLPTVPVKSPMPPPNQQLMSPYENSGGVNDNYYMYQMQQQHQPVHLASHPVQNFKPNYHSINILDNDIRNTNYNYQNSCVDEDKLRMHRNDQFYLHKPGDSAPVQAFQFQTSSPVPNVAYTPPNVATFGQRKTWDNAGSPLQSPTHFTPRYGQKEPSPYKHVIQAKYEDQNPPGAVPSDLDYSNYFANSNSRGDISARHSSAGSISIPSPSADDMAPQCSQSDGSKMSGNEDQTDDAHLSENMNKLHINNGNRTYRIPSPTNKGQSRPNSHYAFNTEDNSKSEKGFYVSFSSNDDDIGRNGPANFADRSPIKVPPRFRKANSNSSLNNDKDRANTKNNSKSRFEQYKKSDGFMAFKNSEIENKPVRKQSSDDSSRTQEKISSDTITIKNKKNSPSNTSAVGLVINADSTNDPAQVDEMERKKERILLQSLQRRQQQEEMRARKEIELQRRKEQEKQKEELKVKKKEEEKRRRAIILEKHRLKKAIEEAEREGKPLDKELLNAALLNTVTKSNNDHDTTPAPKLRSKNHYTNRPRPKTIHIDVGRDLKDSGGDTNLLNFNLNKKGSSVNLAEHNNNNYGMSRRDYYRGSQDLLLTGMDIGNTAGTSASSIYSDLTDEDRGVLSSYPVNGSACGSIGRRRGTSYKTTRDVSLDRATSRIARPKFSSYQSYPRKSSSLMNLCGSSCDQDSLSYNSRYVTDTDSGLGRATPPHRTASPAPSNSSPSGPGSLPPSHHSRRLRYDDTASESGGSEYSGLRLYKQPAVKSNRGIIMNAIEYCVFPGEVNRSAKNRILEEISRSDTTKHFLVLFRDAKCQFRALYSYFPENEEVIKLYGTGPKQVTEKMFDKFFKYNSGGKCFTQVHTKHLTVTIDAFTIHNSLWQGKKVNLPNKRDMSLVI